MWLERLAEWGAAEYTPAGDEPEITLRTERLRKESLMLDRDAYDRRRHTARLQLEAMRTLVTSDQCRSQQLLSYFGQIDSPACGSCDVCRGLHGHVSHAPEDLRKAIVRKLGSRSQTLRQLADALEDDFGRQQVATILREGLDEGWVQRDDNQCFRLTGRD